MDQALKQSLKSDSNTSSGNDFCSQFKKLSLQISALAESVGIEIVPFRAAELPYFSRLSLELRRTVIHVLEVYLSIYQSLKDEGASLLDSKRVVWNALLKLGYRPTSDLFNYIDSGNVIEIHNSNFVQVFRNLKFFELCSYSLEELYCHNLHELYERDLKVEAGLMEYLKKLYSGEVHGVLGIDLEPHIIYEAKSKRYQIVDNIHYMAPLFSSDSSSDAPVATIVFETAELLDLSLIEDRSLPSEKGKDQPSVDNVTALRPPPSSAEL